MKNKKFKQFGMPLLLVSMTLLLAGCQDAIDPTDPGLTYQNYGHVMVGDEITGAGGSSYDEVVSLFGSEPNQKDEVDMGENKLVQTQWYDGDKPESERYISVNFTEGNVSYKGQHGFGE